MSRRTDILDATERLSRFITQEDWAALRVAHLELPLEPVLEERGFALDDVVNRVAAAGHIAPLTAFVDEDFVTLRVGREGSRAIDAFLRRRGWQETPRAREYLQAIGKSSPTLYEVQAVTSGEWIEVRNRLADDPRTLRVDGQSGSRSLQRYDCFIARVVQARGETMLTAGTLTLTRPMAERVDTALRRNGRLGEETTAAVCVREWLRGLLEASERPMPTLQTRDGGATNPASPHGPCCVNPRARRPLCWPGPDSRATRSCLKPCRTSAPRLHSLRCRQSWGSSLGVA